LRRTKIAVQNIVLTAARNGDRALPAFRDNRIVGGPIRGCDQHFIDQTRSAETLDDSRQHRLTCKVFENLARQPSAPHASLNDGDDLQRNLHDSRISKLSPLLEEKDGIDIFAIQIWKTLLFHQFQIVEAFKIASPKIHLPQE